jgi:hypothetical protein
MLLLGLLIFLNIFVWPRWLGIDWWMLFFGVLLVIGGIVKSLKTSCGCKDTCKEMPEMKDLVFFFFNLFIFYMVN